MRQGAQDATSYSSRMGTTMGVDDRGGRMKTGSLWRAFMNLRITDRLNACIVPGGSRD